MVKAMKFRDLKTGRNFTTSNFTLKKLKNNRKAIVTDVPKSIRGKDKMRQAFRFVKKDFKK